MEKKSKNNLQTVRPRDENTNQPIHQNEEGLLERYLPAARVGRQSISIYSH